MPGAAKTLRVALLGIKVPEPRRYHVSIQVLARGQAPAGVVALDSATFDARPDQVARTETTPYEVNPVFLNRVFVMRLPDSLQSSPTIMLHINLFATPTMGTSNAGAIVAGKEVDELVGAATLQIGGELAARLLRGERCTLPAVLASGASEDNGGVRDAVALASMFGSRATRELLLELMLLDAHLTLPRDALLQASVPGQSGAAGEGDGRPGLPPAPCKLQVLVLHAENLPTVRNEHGKEVSPDTFVSATTLRDARSRATPKAVTDTVMDSRNPVWGHLLEVSYNEHELKEEQLVLGIVNDINSRLMLKFTVPLASIVPRLHYNLKLTMPGGLLGSSVALYVSICLVEAPMHEHKRLKRAKPPLNHLLEARLDEVSQQMSALVKASNPPSSGIQYHEMFGVWRLKHNAPPTPSQGGAPAENGSSSSNTEAGPPVQPLRVSNLFTSIDTSHPEDTAKALLVLSDVLSTTSSKPFDFTEAMPLQLLSKGGMLWDPDHLVSLYAPDPASMSLQLELHALSVGGGQPVSLPLGRILLLLPRVGWSMSTSDRQSRNKVHKDIPLQACNAAGTSCSIEICLWQLPTYMESVEVKLPKAGTVEGMSSLADPRSGLSGMTWQGKGAPGGESSSASVTLLEALVDDLLMKQLAVERIARGQDTTEARNEIMGMRVADAENRCRTLAQENQRIRQLLHEDKEAQRDPSLMEVNPNLPREELVERTETALSAYSRERRRNTELVHRLQQMHSEQVDVLEMKKRFQELQAAHMELGRTLSDPNNSFNKLAKYRATVKTQEEVISNLELLLTQTMVRSKALPILESKLKAAQAEADALKRGPLIELDALRKGPLQELEQLRRAQQAARQHQPESNKPIMHTQQGVAVSEVHEMRKQQAREIHDLNTKLAEVEDEKERLKWRAEASREELISTIKRYAEEISNLKWKLAEKDAQLMGGFGGSPMRTPDSLYHAGANLSSSMGGLPYVQAPTYSPFQSNGSTPSRTPLKPLSPQHQQILHPPPQSTRNSQQGPPRPNQPQGGGTTLANLGQIQQLPQQLQQRLQGLQLQQQLQNPLIPPRASSADVFVNQPGSPLDGRHVVSASKTPPPFDPNAPPLTKLPMLNKQPAPQPPPQAGPPGGQMLQAAWPRNSPAGERK